MAQMIKSNRLLDDIRSQGVAHLSPSELRDLSLLLPESNSSYSFGIHTFSIYTAKEIYKHSWNNKTLLNLVMEARRSYQEMYGEIDLLDKYDKKSAIYLIKVSYPLLITQGKKVDVEEWFSLRFVPAAHSPVSNEDLNFYLYDSGTKKIPLWEFVIKHFRRRGTTGYKKILSTFVAQSRFCAIRPYAAKAEEQLLLDKYVKRRKNPLKNAFAGVGYALINKQFLQDTYNLHLSYVTAQMNQSLIDNILSYPPYNKKSSQISLPFIPINQALRLSEKERIYLNRNKGDIPVFLYPGYFLERRSLSKILQYCIKENLLSSDTLKKYLYYDISLKEFFEDPRLIYFRNMGRLLSMKGQINHDTITGEQLRDIINKNVSDGPLLFLMKMSEWQVGIDAYISFVKNDVANKLYSTTL